MRWIQISVSDSGRFHRARVSTPGESPGPRGASFSRIRPSRAALDQAAPVRPERPIHVLRPPPFALEQLERLNHAEALLYRLPKPLTDGRTERLPRPLQPSQRLAALIPPPREHRRGTRTPVAVAGRDHGPSRQARCGPAGTLPRYRAAFA